jgi:hypothetical protein
MRHRISGTSPRRALRFATLGFAAFAACGSPRATNPDAHAVGGPDGAATPDGAPGSPDADGTCAPGSPGVACLIELHDRVASGCDPQLLASFTAQIAERRQRGELPLWSGGRALFVTDKPVAIAGGWNAWSTDTLATTTLCGSSIATAGRERPLAVQARRRRGVGARSVELGVRVRRLQRQRRRQEQRPRHLRLRARPPRPASGPFVLE